MTRHLGKKCVSVRGTLRAKLVEPLETRRSYETKK